MTHRPGPPRLAGIHHLKVHVSDLRRAAQWHDPTGQPAATSAIRVHDAGPGAWTEPIPDLDIFPGT